VPQSLVDFGQSEHYQKDGVIHLTQMDIHEHLTDYLGGRPPDFFEQTSFCGRIMACNEQIMSKTNKPPFYKLEVYFDK
jgi:hypothetical protein